MEALVGFWSQSRTERRGETVRARITESIPYLAHHHQIPYEGDSFRDFVLLYDKVLLDRECGSDPNACLLYFAEKGHFKGVLRALENGATNVTEAIKVAIRNLRLELIEKILWD